MTPRDDGDGSIGGHQPHATGASRRPPFAAAMVTVGVLLATVLILATGWISDDAYITLRVVDNLWNGYGLRWNVLERVQVFTHPLWMLLLAAAYGVTREAFWTTIALSTTLSCVAAIVLSRVIALNAAAAVTALALVASSKSIVEFSTSGLENPLSHCLLVGFLAALWRRPHDAEHVPRAAFLAGLCGVCRLDLLALVGPALTAAVWRHRRCGGRFVARIAAVAGAPLLLWLAFAFVYYGSIWPNTALAKLPANVGLAERLPQGWRYLSDAALADPVTIVALAAGVARAFWRGGDAATGIGLVATLAYVTAIGGDFMTGRFLSAPAFVAIAVLSRHVRWNWRASGALAATSLAIAQATPQSPLRVWRQPSPDDPIVTHGAGIVDERAVYAPYTSVVAVLRGSHPSRHPWARGGRAMALTPGVFTFEAVGLLGYHAGPGVHIVDPMALTDPLLARLPADVPWRIGHFRRPVPPGYVERWRACVAAAFPGHAIAPPTRSCVESPPGVPPMEPAVAGAYARIAVLTQRPLFDPARTALLRRGGL